MLDMGFIPDIERICGLLPKSRQTLFFSATMPPEIQKLTSRFLRDPVKIEVARQNSTAETIDQKLVRVPSKPDEKRAALRAIIRGEAALTNAIIFCNRKRDVATLARSLERHGFNAGALHGDMDQKSRMETLDRFRTGKLSFLVASDVAARGLDIPAVSHVLNFDVPTHAEDYVHRIGRTGRAGRAGTSITLATPSDNTYVDAIQKLIQRDIPQITVRSVESDRKRADTGPQKRRPAPEAGPTANTKPRTREKQPARSERGQSRSPQRPAERKAPANSPFGNDGPIPAFLLVPGRAE
jgi:superfamily II DNA/RNA helicase